MNAESQNPQGGHDAPLTPPPAASVPSVPSGPSAPVATADGSGSTPTSTGSGAKAGAVAIAVFGGIALLGTGGTAAFAATSELTRSDTVQTAGVDGIDGLSLEIGASDVTVEFGDVDEATLEITGGRDNDWRLERDEDELVVRSPDRGFGWWFGGAFGDGWFGGETVVLTLPERLNDGRLDADVSLGAGSLDVDGAFDSLDVEVGAGALSVTGSASSVDAEINAGRADLELDGVQEADLTISAGRLEAAFTGSAPSEIVLDVSAGSLLLTLPDEQYDVQQDVSAGSLDNNLETSSSSRNTISVNLSAGSAVLRPGS